MVRNTIILFTSPYLSISGIPLKRELVPESSNPEKGELKDDNHEEEIVRKVLRADITLGELYNAKSDQYLAGDSLWSTEVLNRIEKNVDTYSTHHFNEGKTTSQRLDAMDISASLKLSFLGINLYFIYLV